MTTTASQKRRRCKCNVRTRPCPMERQSHWEGQKWVGDSERCEMCAMGNHNAHALAQ